MVKHIKKICARNFEEAEQKQIERWITAVGYSYTHALDANGNYAAESGCPIDTCKSRRVEIRIITDDYRVLEEIVKR